ncbi:2'-5'-oligoadenylate synthase 2 isoform X2 [Sarcophilus harrisii]|uniref:2'-5'-oligoadenylate synthase 2 isoform X2 n=1 Tax=Sarcophilus harrisii TaxID=9305 RepID=UPI001301AF76|nr:2'-5'-oligoadenylate synthase 2 isoform X2 [Sarcophilus harrisii]
MSRYFWSWFSNLYSEPAENLDKFIQNNLQPPKKELEKIDERINTICEFLEKQQSPSQVKGIVLGGSYGRNTVLKGHSDGTIVIFFSEPFAEADMKQTFIRDFNLIKIMGKFKTVNEKLQLELTESELTITFDIIPIFSTLVEPSGWQTSRDNKPSINTYQKWIHSKKFAFESPFCFTELQRKFFSNLPPKLKDLILLVKHWYQQCQKQLKQDSFPLQYALELLTVYAWEQGSGEDDFNIDEGILTVLELITKYKELCIYWTVNYDFEDETIRNYLQSQLRKDRPIILDPADPKRNVGGNDPNLWQQLAKEAKTWSTSSAFKKENSSSWKPWDVLPASLYVTQGHMLDKFIYDFLQPEQESLEQIKNVVNTIFKFLTEKCFKDSTMTVKKVVKAGSIAKGTALKSISDPEWNLNPRGSDVDLVVFFNCFQNYNDQIASRATIIKEIQKQLEYCPLKDFEIEFADTKWKNPRVLSFTLKSKLLNRCQEFDLLPAFDALGPQVSKFKPDPETYIKLIESSKCNSGSEFSTCFTELQRDFIRTRTTKLKSLIRLMKHWYKQCHRKLKKKGSLPPKYAVELLTVYAWEQGSGVHDFDTAEGFLTVLKLIMRYKELCIYWTINYDFQNEIIRDFLLSQLTNSRPVILDPADPTGDVGGGDRWCWHLLASEAEIWLSSLCFKRGNFNPVRPWQVPTVQTLGSSGLRFFPIIKPIFNST